LGVRLAIVTRRAGLATEARPFARVGCTDDPTEPPIPGTPDPFAIPVLCSVHRCLSRYDR